MKIEELKSLFTKLLIGCLVAAAGVAVIAVLVGEFNEILMRAIWTLVLVMIHAFASLGYVGSIEKSGNKSLTVFRNTVFTILILSFFTSVFGAWGLLSGDVVGKLYLTYFIFVFAALHGEMLADTTGKESRIDNIVYTNYFFMAVVIFMLLPIIWLLGDGSELPDFYYRLLAASAIIDATLTILAVILHRVYLQKHPKIQSAIFTPVQQALDANGNPAPQQAATPPRRGLSPLMWILLAIILLPQILGGVFWLIFSLVGGGY